MRTKNFELEIGRNIYQGEYHYEGNELVIDECFLCIIKDEFDIEELKEIDSLNNREEYSKVYKALEKDTCDEKMDEAEYNAELRYSIAEEKAEEKRKG